ncbi:MAG: TorD/DmsD family molecular chaperone [Candidatus Latescibacterota bacterium]
MQPDVRYYFYDLFFSMLVREPSDSIIEAWGKGLAAAAESDIPESLRRSAGDLLSLLQQEGVQETVREEFMRLFWNPEGPMISLLASRYVDGGPFGNYLVRLRTFLEKTPFRKREDYREPEDSLAFHLDLMRSFILEECATECLPEKNHWRNLQSELMNDYLCEWVFRPLRELSMRDTERFYQRAAGFLRAFIEHDRETIGDGLINSH